MGSRMHRATVLLFGLLLALVAFALVLVPMRMPPPRAAPAPIAVEQARAPAEAELGTGTEPEAGRGFRPASVFATRLLPWAGGSPAFACLLAAGGVACVLAWRLARGRVRAGHGRSNETRAHRDRAHTTQQPHNTRRAAATARPDPRDQALPLARADFTTQLWLTAQPDSATSGSLKQTVEHRRPPAASAQHPAGVSGPATETATPWLRSEAGDKRASAALSAVDDVLAAGGWRSRVLGAATGSDPQRSTVGVNLALHPAERHIGAAVAERVRATHPAWQVTGGGEQMSIDVGEQPPGPSTLVLPVLQSDNAGPSTYYLYAAAAPGLAITGAGAGEVLHGLLADLLCMYPPTSLALTGFGAAQAELYRGAPQWVEPPDMSAATIERLAQHVDSRPGGAYRPLLLTVFEPDEQLARALAGLEHRLSALRSPPVALIVAAERPGSQYRALASALPELTVRSRGQRRTAELRLAERRVTGLPPCFAAADLRELLRWLPRFGASPPACIWDTIAAAPPHRAVGDDDDS